MHDSSKPYFLITIDTEGDNLWEGRANIGVDNARFLPRFQELCEKHGLKPVYLTDYEMACCGVFQDFAKDVLKRGAAEIGMHLHAWNSPPEYRLTDDDALARPYLIEYPLHIMRKKIDYMTKLLQDIFQMPIRSHRAGRWAFNNFYARCLVEHQYTVDCSVTPLVSWTLHKGDPAQKGGSDYSRFPQDAYRLNIDDISKPGNAPLLEVPVTVVCPRRWMRRLAPSWLYKNRIVAMLINYCCPVKWLRPTGTNLESMLEVLDAALAERRDYVEFMLHSSELMPGGSPTFRTPAHIEKLYDDLEILFAAAQEKFRGGTLQDFNGWFLQQKA